MVGRIVLRVACACMSLALLILWFFLVRYLYLESDQQPPPALLMLPLLFFVLGGWAFAGAVRDDAVAITVGGGLSFVPVGAFLLFMPGFARWIGILALGILVLGVVLMQTSPWPSPPPDGLREGPP